MMKHVDRYIASTLLSAIGMVMVVLLVLGGLFLFIGEQGSIGVGRYTAFEALLYSAMNLPRFALEALPAGTLIGAMLAIGTLARNNEITIMRAAGMSKRRLVMAALSGGVVVVIAALLVGEYLAPHLEQMADERKAFAKYDDISFAGSGGAWMRDGNTFINVETQSSAAEFGGMLVFELDGERRLAAVGHAERATAAGNNAWQMYDYSETRFEGDRVSAQRSASRTLQSVASVGFLQLAVALPAQMALQSLYRAMQYRRANELDASSYEFAFWSRLASTVALLVGMVLAVPFGMGLMRAAGAGARMTLGLAIGIVYFFLQRVVGSGAVVFSLSPLLLAWLPTLLLALAAGVLLWRAR
jgi:lipopolysaccharide export system permease protein